MSPHTSLSHSLLPLPVTPPRMNAGNQTLIWLLSLYTRLNFLKFWISGIIQCALYFVWLSSFSRMILRVIEVCIHSSVFLLLSNIPLNEYSTVFLSFGLLRDTWVVSSWRLFQIQLHWTFAHKSLYGHVIHSPQVQKPEVDSIFLSELQRCYSTLFSLVLSLVRDFLAFLSPLFCTRCLILLWLLLSFSFYYRSGKDLLCALLSFYLYFFSL